MAKLDSKLTTADAIEIARQAACELSEQTEQVGDYIGAVSQGERLVSHRFVAQVRGYRGWHWDVVVARAPRSTSVTVCEAHLQPGEEAILAETWVPYADRLRPGDLGPTDVLPFRPDDPRLEPGWVPTGAESEEDLVPIEELALARARVLSQDGVREAAQRWYRGRNGPRTTSSVISDQPCFSCGFLVPLQGSLGQLFGVCVNEWSDDDGRVVSYDHGCGAHSQTDAAHSSVEWPAPGPSYGDLDLEIVDMSTVEAAPDTTAAAADQAEATETAEAEVVPEVQPEVVPEADPEVTTEAAPAVAEAALESGPDATTEVTPETTPAVSEVTPEAAAEELAETESE